MADQICYLCGKPGADTRDHVPPKGFLGKGTFNGQNRITIPAHRACNQEIAPDEEYVRDLLGPAAEELRLAGVQDVLAKVDRSRKRDGGFSRRQQFLKDAKVITKRTSSGLFVGEALGVTYDRERLLRVGRKIARGILYHDTNMILDEHQVNVASIPLWDVEREKNEQITLGNPYWVLLSNENALHDMFAESVSVRRFYFGQPTTPKITIECMMAVVLLSEFFVVCTSFPAPDDPPHHFTYAIDTTTGLWQKSGESPRAETAT